MCSFRRFVCIIFLGICASNSRAVEIVWNDARGIHRFDTLENAPAQQLFETSDTRGIAFDPQHRRLIWTDVLPLGGPLPGGMIRAGSLNGGPIENPVTQLLAPAGVQFDSQNQHIIWSDLGDDATPSSIWRADADGSDARQWIRNDILSEITGLAIDAENQVLYFTYINPLIDSIFNGAIARAELRDLSNVETIFSGLARPKGVAVNAMAQELFWAEAGLSDRGEDGAIMAGVVGETPRIVLGGLSEPYGIALDLRGQSVYWTDQATGKLQRTSMSGVLPFFEDVLTDLPSPTALTIVPEPSAFLLLLLALVPLRQGASSRCLTPSSSHGGALRGV